MIAERNVPLQSCNSFGIVARAQTLVRVRQPADVQAVLVTPPPGPEGCPALQVLVPALAKAGAFPDWIGYISATRV